MKRAKFKDVRGKFFLQRLVDARNTLLEKLIEAETMVAF